MSRLNPLILIVCCFLLVNNLQEIEVTVGLGRLYEEHTGKKGTIVVTTDYNSAFDNFVDTSKTPIFKTSVSNERKNYDVDCGFYKTEDENLYVFCNIKEDIPSGNYILSFNESQVIGYENYKLTFSGNNNFQFTKYDKDIVDLYSGKQNITVEEGKDSYELKFKISSYNQEKIMLYYAFLDCSQKNEELICHITRKQIDSMLQKSELELRVMYNSYITYSKQFPLIPTVKVIYNNVQKTDVFVLLTKLIENTSESSTTIAYETNVTNIDNVQTDYKYFSLDFNNNDSGTKAGQCSFRKYDDTPLLVVCFVPGEGTNWLKEITEEQIYDNLNIKYNFRLQPVNIEDKIDAKKISSTFIYYFYPPELDFTKDDSLIIEYNMKSPTHSTGITFNENKPDLDCRTLGEEIKRCTVPKSHFEGKKSGYYFTMHKNHLDGKSFNYEAAPVKVILDEGSHSKGNIIISLSLYYWLLLILIMI